MNSVHHLDVRRALLIVSDEVCRDLELFLEHVFPTNVAMSAVPSENADR